MSSSSLNGSYLNNVASGLMNGHIALSSYHRKRPPSIFTFDGAARANSTGVSHRFTESSPQPKVTQYVQTVLTPISKALEDLPMPGAIFLPILKRHDYYTNIELKIEQLVLGEDETICTDADFELAISYCLYHRELGKDILPHCFKQYFSLYIVNSLHKDHAALQNIIKRLEPIQLDYLNLAFTEVTNEQLDLFMRLPLQRILLMGCHKLSNRSFYSLLKIKDTLTSLDLNHCQWVSNDFIDHLEKLKLQHLGLKSCNGKNISFTAYKYLVQLPLTSLNLSECAWLDAAKLTYFNANAGSSQFPLSKTLRYLYLSGTVINNDNLSTFLTPTLESLDISSCKNLTMDAINDIKKFGVIRLNVSNNGWFYDLFKFSTDDFRKLTTLEAFNTPLSNSDISKFTLLGIKNLDISRCFQLTTDCFKSLNQMTSLQTINGMPRPKI